ncbi:MAG: hypothetical protein AAF570_28280, partial [Bacteroidota bacterium]
MKVHPTSLWLLILTTFPTWISAQLPTVRGQSVTHSGMLYYDVNAADDMRDAAYEYTVCPEKATCISLDFNLVESQNEVDFITVYEGKSREGKVIGTLGGDSGSLLLQSNGGCMTFVFEKDAASRHSVWTALWRSQLKGDCIDPGANDDRCADVKEICGPEYHEPFHHFGPGQLASDSAAAQCLEREHNAHWYRFVARKDGDLEFFISPDNGFDDYDWVLWRGDPEKPEECPDLARVEQKMACNYAAGRGPQGATGMADIGDALEAGMADNPFCKPLPVKKGEVFFLLIDDYSRHSTGFTLRF